MDNVAQADADAAVEIIRAATTFDWTWGRRDIEHFSALVDWKPDDFGNATTVFMTTSAAINHPVAWFELNDGLIQEFSFHVTDRVDTTEQIFLIDAFATVSSRINDLLGAPTRRLPGRRPGLQWDQSKLIVELLQLNKSITITLINPKYRKPSNSRTALPN
ncbi:MULTISPECIES: DUF6301 family protein [unclassified Nocardia]|uniref:DUF6301 family protein n=1 Tax=unclassified Nocardia TaxID=2637762 RepID=UPI001CE408E6|nr:MULTISPECIES: DUF6301 family protein [unclassified Nocardia]